MNGSRAIGSGWTAVVILFSLLPGLAHRAEGSPLQSAPPISVPQAVSAAVVLDGRFSPGEWDDALCVANGLVSIYMKKCREEIFIGISCLSCPLPGVDLFLSSDAGDIRQLRVTGGAQERELSPRDLSEVVPQDVWAVPSGWAAGVLGSEVHPVVREACAPGSRPDTGVEFKIRQSKFPGQLWKMRIELALPSGPRQPLVFPEETGSFNTERWLSILIS